MSNADVEIIIGATDNATKVLNSVSLSVEDKVKRIRDVGGKAKASTEFIGQIANTFGGSQIGQVAGQVAALTDKVAAFSEVSKAGGLGAAAFKTGLVGITAVLAFQVGSAIGNAVFQTQEWKDKLAEAKQEAQRLDAALVQAASRRFNVSIEEISLIRDPEEQSAETARLLDNIEQQIVAKNEQIWQKLEAEEDFNTAWFGSPEDRAQLRDTTAEEKQLELLRQQRDQLQQATSERRKSIEDQRKQNALLDSSAAYVQRLREENELLRASEEHRPFLEADRMTFASESDSAEAVELIREKQALLAKQEAEKLAADEARIAIEEQERNLARILDLRDSELRRLEQQNVLIEQGTEGAKAFALVQQGLDETTANQIAAEEARIQKIQEAKQAERERAAEIAERDKRLAMPTAGISATQGRLLTRGNNDSLQERMAKAADESRKFLEMIANQTKPQPPQVPRPIKVLSL